MHEPDNQAYLVVYLVVAAVMSITVIVWIVFLHQIGVLNWF